MVNKAICLLFLVLLHSSLYSQDTGDQQNASLSPNDLGALQNSVNLYTGQVAFPMTVASLPGRSGLSPKVTINYNSSGVKSNVETWNREKPTGILGLGWSFNFPKIVSNHNNTATRHDDTFYLIEGGQSVRLICTKNDNTSNGPRLYSTEIHQPWKVTYYPSEEKWEIIKDNGITYIYGDQSRERADGTIQYMVNWGNWIGSSNNRTGQSNMAYIWNLSEIKSLMDDKITYTYENIEEAVGTTPATSNPAKHTKASVLSKIEGPLGNYLQLNYEMKIYEPCATSGDFRCTDRVREYQDPHVEKVNEPDAYQEKYEPRYLDNIEAYDHNGQLLFDVNFGYNQNEEGEAIQLGNGEFYKRLLTSIEQTNYGTAKLPKTTFEYCTSGCDQPGYLTAVSNSIGGRITYQYDFTSTTNGEICIGSLCSTWENSSLAPRKFEVQSPGYEWIEPDIYMGPDYAVVIWRKFDEILDGSPVSFEQARLTHLQIYEWRGEWVKHDIGFIGLMKLSRDINKRESVVALEQDHFAIALRQGTDSYRVNLFHKNKFDGSWSSYTDESVFLYDGRLAEAQYLSELYLLRGDDFHALGNLNSSRLYFYTWNGTGWVKSTETFDPLEIPSPIGGDPIISRGMNFTSSSKYLLAHNINIEPDKFWLYLLKEDGNWLKEEKNLGFRADAVQSNERREDRTYWYSTPAFSFTMADDNPEYAFVFDEYFNGHERFDLGVFPDHYAVSTPSTSNINISANTHDQFERGYLSLFRFNGNSWWNHEFPNGFPLFAGAKRADFAPDVAGLSFGSSSLTLLSYNANMKEWKETDYKVSPNWLDRYVKVSPNSALMGDQIYYKEPDGEWIIIGSIETEGLADNSWERDLKSSNDLYVVSKPYNKTEFYKVVNGDIKASTLYQNMDKRTAHYDVGDRLLGNNMMATFAVENRKKYDARNFDLYKWTNDKFSNGHKSVVVKSVTVNDGNLDIYKSYDYNVETAKVDNQGNIPLFNEVTVVSGSNDPNLIPKGYTKHYFYNGKPMESLPKVPDEQEDNDILLFAGSHYLTEMYSSTDELISSSETVYSTFRQNVLNNDGTLIDQSYFVRPTRATTKEFLANGIQAVTTHTSYNASGYPKSVINISNDDQSSIAASSQTAYVYYPEKYDVTSNNLYGEIVGTKNYKNGEVVSSSATVWGEVNGIPQAVSTYRWRGFDGYEFSEWSGGTPSTQWRLSNKITKRDDKGNILESIDRIEDYQSAIYDELLLNPTLSASYATYDQLAGTSFEDGQDGKVSYTGKTDQDAYTGTFSMFNSSANAGNFSNDTYHVYYWYKGDPGVVTVSNGTVEDLGDQNTAKGWTLRKWKVLGSGEISVSTSQYIDELRIHPEGAYVTTFVYNNLQQKTAETGPDMLTTFYTYDNYNRQHYITDHKGNIVLHYEYGFKKLDK